MFENTTTNDGSIFRSESPLTAEYSPEQFIGREYEIQKIADALRPLTRRQVAENLLIYGPAGVGKSSCVKHVLSNLESETTVKTVEINCWQYNTRPSLLTELLIQLGYPAPRKGKPVDELLGKLKEWLDKNRGVAVGLDEFDQLSEMAEVIYDLQTLSRKASHNLGLLLVSNQHPSQLHLDPRSQSRLSCQTLCFEPYSSDQLRQILRQRSNQAFQSDAVEENVIDIISRRLAEQGSDCRKALELLRKAGRKAEQENASTVTADHLPQSMSVTDSPQ